MNETVVRARIDPSLKTDVEAVFDALGLSTSEAIRLFLSQVSLRKGLPFPNENEELLVSPTMRQKALDSVFDD